MPFASTDYSGHTCVRFAKYAENNRPETEPIFVRTYRSRVFRQPMYVYSAATTFFLFTDPTALQISGKAIR